MDTAIPAVHRPRRHNLLGLSLLGLISVLSFGFGLYERLRPVEASSEPSPIAAEYTQLAAEIPDAVPISVWQPEPRDVLPQVRTRVNRRPAAPPQLLALAQAESAVPATTAEASATEAALQPPGASHAVAAPDHAADASVAAPEPEPAADLPLYGPDPAPPADPAVASGPPAG